MEMREIGPGGVCGTDLWCSVRTESVGGVEAAEGAKGRQTGVFLLKTRFSRDESASWWWKRIHECVIMRRRWSERVVVTMVVVWFGGCSRVVGGWVRPAMYWVGRSAVPPGVLYRMRRDGRVCGARSERGMRGPERTVARHGGVGVLSVM